MNILISDAAKYWSGGAERVYLCCKGFKEKGHNVILVCLPTSRLNSLLKDELKIYNVHPIFDLDFLAGFKIFYIFLKHKIDVLDIHSPKFYWLGVFIGKFLNRKVFITRNVDYRKKGFKKFINRFLYRLCDGVIAVSEKVMTHILEDFKIDDKKIVTIEDAYVVDRSLVDVRKKYKISEDAIVLSIIGRIERNKGQHIAIKILNSLSKKYNVKLFVIGPIEEKDYYKEIYKEVLSLKLEENVIFTGFVSNVQDYIVASDIIICCSKYESRGKAFIESMLLGKPVVSICPINVEDIKILDQSLLHIVSNFEEFIASIENIIKRRKYKFNYFVKHDRVIYGFEEMVNKYLNFYEKFLY